MANYTATADELCRRTDDVFAWLAARQLQVHIGGRYPLRQVQLAFSALESRATTGKLVLTH